MKLRSPWAIKACCALNSIQIPLLVPFVGQWKQCLNLEATPRGTGKNSLPSFPYLHRLELHPCDPWGVYHWLGASQRVQNILPLRWQAHKFALLWVKWGVDTVLKVLRGRDLWAFLLLLAEHDAWIEEGNTVSACLGLKCPSSKITYQFYELIICYIENILQQKAL